MRILRPALLCVLFFCTTLCVAEKPWTEIRSAHFRLITDGEDSAANRVLLHFELMRAVFEAQSPNFKLEAPAALLILAPKDEASAKRLLPWMWAHPGTKPAGIYMHGWEREYALVRLDVIDTDPEGYQTVYHEYMHNVSHNNFQGLPAWLDEGLADFYGYTRFDKDKMYIGAPPSIESVRDMDSWPSMPLAAFINSNMYSSDWEKTHRSYLQAWGLTHFLFFGPDMGNGKRLGQFLGELQRGVEQNKAFEETIGKFADVQGAYDKHIHTLNFAVIALPVPLQLGDKNFTERKLSPGETEAEMAAWYIRFHDWDRMRESTEAALKDDPNLSLAHEDMGFLEFNEGKGADALKEFTRATELDGKNYVALFAEIMTSPLAKSSSPQDQQLMYGKLNEVIGLKPDFAPAYIELAKLKLAQGELAVALGLVRKAVGLEPLRSGYRLMTGELLLRMGRPSEAAAVAAYVVSHSYGSDRDEALELWNRIPEADRQVEPPRPADIAEVGQLAQGTVVSVSCNGMEFAITLDVSGKSETFKSKGFPVSFQDTLWVGQDHFSPCFHVQGLRAVARYKPIHDSSYAGDLTHAAFRDDLPVQYKTLPNQASTP